MKGTRIPINVVKKNGVGIQLQRRFTNILFLVADEFDEITGKDPLPTGLEISMATRESSDLFREAKWHQLNAGLTCQTFFYSIPIPTYRRIRFVCLFLLQEVFVTSEYHSKKSELKNC